jgi:glucose/arabinose dehydrogenase
MLHLSVGDYDYGTTSGPNGIPWALDTGQPVGKLLRVEPDGQAPNDNPLADDADADGRVVAYGFARGADFAFDSNGNLLNTDATDSCEEINLVTAGGNYSWPDVGPFPFSDCNAGPGNKPIYLLSKPDTNPGEFLSFVRVSGMAYLDSDRYPEIGAGLLVCEEETGLMRRLVLGGTNGQEVTANDVVTDDCTGSVAVGPDGLIYYSNDTEVRRLNPEEEGS